MKELKEGTSPVQVTSEAVKSNGRQPIEDAAPTRQKGRGISKKLVVLPVLLIVLVLGANLGYQYWVGQQLYVSTDNAQVAGPMVQVGALNAGRIESVQVNVGDRVQRDQVVGTILLPTTISMSQNGTPVLGF